MPLQTLLTLNLFNCVLVTKLCVLVNGYGGEGIRAGQPAPLNFSLPHHKSGGVPPVEQRAVGGGGGGGGLYRPYSTSPTPQRTAPGTEHDTYFTRGRGKGGGTNSID